MGNLRLDLRENSDRQIFANVLMAVKDTLEELQIHENGISEEVFLSHFVGPLSSMPRLKFLNLGKNGQLNENCSVHLLNSMVENQ